jgi:hypothetical protein
MGLNEGEEGEEGGVWGFLAFRCPSKEFHAEAIFKTGAFLSEPATTTFRCEIVKKKKERGAAQPGESWLSPDLSQARVEEEEEEEEEKKKEQEQEEE